MQCLLIEIQLEMDKMNASQKCWTTLRAKHLIFYGLGAVTAFVLLLMLGEGYHLSQIIDYAVLKRERPNNEHDDSIHAADNSYIYDERSFDYNERISLAEFIDQFRNDIKERGEY